MARSSKRSSSDTAETFGARDWVGLLAPRFGRRAGAPPRLGAADELRGADEREDPPAERVGVDEW
jgi:hypothetical protein